jgi:hypothetical protein
MHCTHTSITNASASKFFLLLFIFVKHRVTPHSCKSKKKKKKKTTHISGPKSQANQKIMSTPAPPALGELRALRQAFEPRLARHAPAARLVRAGVLGDRPMLTAALFIAANMAVFFVTGWVKCGTCCRPLRIVQALAAAAIFARIAKFACGVAKICPIDMASKPFVLVFL